MDLCSKGHLPTVNQKDLEIGKVAAHVIKRIWIGETFYGGSGGIPTEGPYILASNHTSWLDLFVLICIPYNSQRTRVLAHECVLGILGKLSAIVMTKYFGCFIASVVAAKQALAEGSVVAICCEGWAWSAGGVPHEFHTGAVRISNAGNCPIVPVNITYGNYPGEWVCKFGKFQYLLCAMMPWLYRTAYVTIGKAYVPSTSVLEETAELRDKIIKLGGYTDELERDAPCINQTGS